MGRAFQRFPAFQIGFQQEEPEAAAGVVLLPYERRVHGKLDTALFALAIIARDNAPVYRLPSLRQRARRSLYASLGSEFS